MRNDIQKIHPTPSAMDNKKKRRDIKKDAEDRAGEIAARMLNGFDFSKKVEFQFIETVFADTDMQKLMSDPDVRQAIVEDFFSLIVFGETPSGQVQF
jgi:hypothetical protein